MVYEVRLKWAQKRLSEWEREEKLTLEMLEAFSYE